MTQTIIEHIYSCAKKSVECRVLLSCFLSVHQLCELTGVVKHYPELFDEAIQAMYHEISCNEANASNTTTNGIDFDGRNENDVNTYGDCDGRQDTNVSSRNITLQNIFPSETDARGTGVLDKLIDEMKVILRREGTKYQGHGARSGEIE